MNSNALEIVDLKEISVLRRSSGDKPGDIKAVHVYGSCRSSSVGLGALYVTKQDEVYLAGFGSLVGKCCTKGGPHGHKEAVVQSKKVEELSGRGAKKIVIGDEFGAALCGVGSELYLWGNGLAPGRRSQLPAGLSQLEVEGDYGGACCPKCFKKLNKSGDYELLLYCTCNGKAVYHNRISVLQTVPDPTDWTGPTHKAFGYKATGTPPQIPNLFCARCGKDTPCKVILVSNFCLLYCSSSHIPHNLNKGRSFITLNQTSPTHHKVMSSTSLQIIDIAAGKNFLLLQTSFGLMICGVLGGVKYYSYSGVSIVRVSCGSSHIAVVTDKVSLRTCGVGDKGHEWTSDMDPVILKRFKLNEPVVDVACGKNSTVCLQNGT